ncbi:hypothetical protein M406DRAFT_257346 [Cryphonectria parasitica EP155]|uniref:Uncharacterized protein n=1 Tax=Cryphonectria parasitica (strain ATCC 38755 / EP155) TaxID=660469 RepID=A0A9P5CPN0_CRYP1|nr:uncharacterized protein M406DRAFT_257346 [Cryphonectria parasitica EP155]KAF3765587.1 hypothetical protein M406DRAFT_257346 [Cryphonectria parasitica EP155]
MRPSSYPLATGLDLSSLTNITHTYNLTDTNCHDGPSYLVCADTASIKAEACNAVAEQADSQTALTACNCVYYSEMMNCYMASCWNKVYECEYQEYAIQYISECALDIRTAGIPFFPFPSGAPDSCSCNLGTLYMAIDNSEAEGADCATAVSSAALSDAGTDPVTTADEEAACACCGESGALSAFYDICPGTDPAFIGINNIFMSLASFDQPWSTCAPFLNAYACNTDLNFTSPAYGTFYTPDNMPENGTASLSNIAGTVSAPPSGTVFSYTNHYYSTVYTITADIENTTVAVTVTGTTGAVGTPTQNGAGPFSTSQSAARVLSPMTGWRPSAAFMCLMFII